MKTRTHVFVILAALLLMILSTIVYSFTYNASGTNMVLLRWASLVTTFFGALFCLYNLMTFLKQKKHIQIRNRVKGCWIALTSTCVIVLGAEPKNKKNQIITKFCSHNLPPTDITWLLTNANTHFSATMGANTAMDILKGGASPDTADSVNN